MKKKARKRKKRLSPEEIQKNKISRKHKTDIRTAFTNCGFEHIPTREKNIVVNGRTGEFDGLYAYENIIVFVEDTNTQKQKNILDHLRKKCEFYGHVKQDEMHFLSVLKKAFPSFRGYMKRKSQYDPHELKLIHVYASYHTIDSTYKKRYESYCQFLDYPYLQYFVTMAKAIQKSARFELFKFLDLELQDIGLQSSSTVTNQYDGLLLPETPSGFPRGYKVVSFLVDPQFLMEQAYVLRADSWQDTECLYQRLLIKGKIKNMRAFLDSKKRTYINNIIVTLPSATKILDTNCKEMAAAACSKIEPIIIQIPKMFNTIGIIDGQHRVYSYHEGGDKHDRAISKFRGKQHLLVTGIIYPQNINSDKKREFEANLFLEINDKQKRVKGDLKQAIEMMVNPRSAIAVSKAVIEQIAATGPLTGLLEVHFYDKGKIKTTSVVSYGLKHIIGLDSENSFYHGWRNSRKGLINNNRKVLDDYIAYCANEINTFISAFKDATDNTLWTTDKKVSRILTTTTINGLIFCLRRLIEHKQLGNFDHYKKRFKNLNIDFHPDGFEYKSSHWKDLGEKIYRQCFCVSSVSQKTPKQAG